MTNEWHCVIKYSTFGFRQVIVLGGIAFLLLAFLWRLHGLFFQLSKHLSKKGHDVGVVQFHGHHTSCQQVTLNMTWATPPSSSLWHKKVDAHIPHIWHHWRHSTFITKENQYPKNWLFQCGIGDEELHNFWYQLISDFLLLFQVQRKKEPQTCFNIPQCTGHVSTACHNLLIIQESTAREVSGKIYSKLKI